MPRIRKSHLDSLEVSSSAGQVRLRTYERRRGPDGPYTRQHVRGLTVREARTFVHQLNEAISDAEGKSILPDDALQLLGMVSSEDL
jgi:hypothetical protein